MSITHGVVSIEDGKKADSEYTPARKVRVELHFDVAEGQDYEAILTAVADRADLEVRRRLGQTVTVNTTVAAPVQVSAAASTQVSAAASTQVSSAAAERPARQAGPRSKPKPIEVVLPPEPKPDPAAVEEVVDDFSAAPPTAEVRPITDAELHSAAQKKNGEIKNPLAIRTLVGEFRPPGSTVAFQLAQIPQERRQEFLNKLAKLT